MAFPFFKKKKIEPSFAKATEDKKKKVKPKKSAVRVGEEDKSSSLPFAAARVIETPKEKPAEVKTPKIKKEVKFGGAFRVLKAPHVTEKATDLTASNQYVFRIYPRANKVDVKKAIEKVFGVDVTGVRVINIPKKKRRLGKIKGFKEGYKKAIIKIKEGQKIEVLLR